MKNDVNLSVTKAEQPQTIMIDYGGPNVAKPLHVGHLHRDRDHDTAVRGQYNNACKRHALHVTCGTTGTIVCCWRVLIDI